MVGCEARHHAQPTRGGDVGRGTNSLHHRRHLGVGGKGVQPSKSKSSANAKPQAKAKQQQVHNRSNRTLR